MNRKRKAEESYKDYHASMKEEVARIKAHLQGNYIHVSKTFTVKGIPLRGVTRKGSFKNE